MHLSCLWDLNGHHQEWLGSTTTNRHGVAAFDFATVSGCDQCVVRPTRARGGTRAWRNMVTTDFPDLVRVNVLAPIGNSVTPLSVGSHFDGSCGSKLVC